MRLKARVNKLDAGTREAYEKAWDAFYSDFLDRTPHFLKQKEQQLAQKCPDLAKAEEQPPAAQNREKVIETCVAELKEGLGDTPLHGLDIAAFLAWDQKVADEMPFLDAPETWNLAFWPNTVTPPPAEPPGIYDDLKALLGDEGDKGTAAFHLLYSLEAARVVRRYVKGV